MRLHRALDQGRAGGQVLLDDQEIALPFGLSWQECSARQSSATRALPPSATWLAMFSKVVGIDRDAEAGRQGLAVELGGCGPVDAAINPGRAVARSWSGPKSRVNPVMVTA